MPEGAAGTGNPAIDLLIVFILILIGGVFAAAEIALLTVRRTRLEQLADEGKRGAETARRLVEDPQRFLATIQVVITFLGFLASAIGAIAFSAVIADAISTIPLEPVQDAAETIAFILVTLLIALTSIIAGELVPKTLALNFPERFSLVAARPLSVMERVLAPLVWLTTTISGFLVRLFGGRERPQTGLLSVEELKLLVETGSAQGQIEEAEKEMIHGVIELGDKQIHEVMIPRIGIKAVEVDDPIEEVLDLIVRAGHSRVPVYRENLDNIVGILYAKDMLPYLLPAVEEREPLEIRSLARPAAYVPETKRVDEMLTEMRAARRHIAIVVDEYGGTAGLVTIEDLVEEIVGEIQDEYDMEESLVEPVETDGDRRAFRLDGRVTMDDLRDLFELGDAEEPDEESFDTIGGLIIHRVGRIPLVGTEVDFRDLTLRVLAADSRRVSKVLAVQVEASRETAENNR
ncbi:MAG TPA: hemolysin family protein [Candidatus Limnocylindria bacterium]|jgi:putative hemolysin|nr:hemolysin family protein [Candidatus Limnocylindria bacterium]